VYIRPTRDHGRSPDGRKRLAMITRTTRRLYVYTVPVYAIPPEGALLAPRWEFKRGHDLGDCGDFFIRHGGIIERPFGSMSRLDVQNLYDLLGAVLADWPAQV